jgi:hypothetical protein
VHHGGSSSSHRGVLISYAICAATVSPVGRATTKASTYDEGVDEQVAPIDIVDASAMPHGIRLSPRRGALTFLDDRGTHHHGLTVAGRRRGWSQPGH